MVMGLCVIAFSPGFLYLGLRHSKRTDYASLSEGSGLYPNNWSKRLALAIGCALFFLEVEAWSTSTMLSLFGMRSALGLTAARAALLNTVFGAFNAVSRLGAIFLCRLVDARRSIYLYLMLVAVPAVITLLRQDALEFTEACIYIALIGLGAGPLYSTTVMIVEHYMPVTDQIQAIMYTMDNTRDMLVPLVLGQYLDEYPMVLMFYIAGTTILSILLVFAFSVLASKEANKN